MSPDNNDAGRPPMLGSWRNVYLLVAGVLVALIAGFYFFTKHFQ
jgi:hypothetical protein